MERLVVSWKVEYQGGNGGSGVGGEGGKREYGVVFGFVLTGFDFGVDWARIGLWDSGWALVMDWV